MSNENGKAAFSARKGNGIDTRTYNDAPSLTRQEFAEECDINNLMKRYEGHVFGGPGGLPPINKEAMYVDFTQMPTDLMGFMEMQMNAERAFMSLPAIVRRDMDNDPLKFVEFANDPANLDKLREYGLAPPRKAEEAPPPPPQAEKAPPPPEAPKP